MFEMKRVVQHIRNAKTVFNHKNYCFFAFKEFILNNKFLNL
ncbi:hypothetical protein M2132_000323 [Dysgonomonas sp. PH5-45]|nr:hypothetical protein [Dysgonomonas sp. PH5-45]MDH6386905.1 hypothetical protein [Dysgonomonas sp. PH5-37]